jgi:hypothetical protein
MQGSFVRNKMNIIVIAIILALWPAANKEKYKNIKILSSKGIEPFTAINQFFYRESPLPIGSPALNLFFYLIIF